jgi:hypothetical protein
MEVKGQEIDNPITAYLAEVSRDFSSVPFPPPSPPLSPLFCLDCDED